MLKIECPWCGERAETEFSFGGQAHIVRPVETDSISDEVWGDYVFMRDNIKGWQREQWCHSHGCRQWFFAIRNTATHEFACVYRVGEALPDLPAL